MKYSFSVAQYMYVLFECPHNPKIAIKHTIAVFGEFCVISLFLQNLILSVM